MTGRRKIGWIVSAVVVVVLVVGGAAYGLKLIRGRGVGGLKVGDCVAASAHDEPPYKKTPCADPGSYDTVLAFKGRDDADACRDVPGATGLFVNGDQAVCLGDKGVDPARGINVAKKGDCVELPNPRTAYRIDCGDPKAAYQIVLRMTDVSKKASAAGACTGVPGVIQAYAWNWNSSDPIARLTQDQSDDVVLCLGAGPTVIASYSAAQEERSNCRYISDQDLGAAVSKATGKQYTVRSHNDGKFGCDYRFTKDGEYVTVEMSRGLEWRPGTGSDVLTVDGLRTYYDPGEGNRALGVEIAGGVFSVVVRLADTRDSTSKKVGTAVFQAARPKVN